MKIKGARNRTLKRRQLDAIYQRKRYKEHKRLGICGSCSRKTKTGFVFCLVCQAWIKKWWMARHPLFCLECRKLIKPEERWRGNRFHKLCGQKRRARYPQLHRLAVLAYRRRHRKMGLCFSCPRKVFKSWLCRKHYRMERERKHRAAGSVRRVS